MVFQSLGTPSNSAIHNYMNDEPGAAAFRASGATKWDDPANFPWTMGWQPNYQTEGHDLREISAGEPPARQDRVLYQNDDYGKDHVKGLKDVGRRGRA